MKPDNKTTSSQRTEGSAKRPGKLINFPAENRKLNEQRILGFLERLDDEQIAELADRCEQIRNKEVTP